MRRRPPSFMVPIYAEDELSKLELSPSAARLPVPMLLFLLVIVGIGVAAALLAAFGK